MAFGEAAPSRRARLVRARALAAVLVLGLLTFAGCSLGGDDDEPVAASAPAQADPMRLDVLVYNVEYGGGPETDAVIRQLDADVVGVLESYERLPEIARRTGYPYYNTSLQLLSKYPILEPSGGDGLYALIEVEPGYVVPFFNVHLDYVAWGPRMLRNGHPVEAVIESENEVRTSAMEEPFAAMSELLEDGYPIFLTGDFNQPSSLDYVEETAGSRPEIPEPVAWPVSEKLFELGFRDTYRETHPDPVKDPGITQNRSGERIDYVYAAGPSTTVDSKLVGERGGEDVEIEGDAPWISDHRAVLSTFEVTPVAMPTLVAVDARLRTVGDEIEVTYNAAGADKQIVVVPEGGDPSDAIETLDAPGDRETTSFNTAGWDPGGYEVVLSEDEGTETARVAFYLRDPEAQSRTLDRPADLRAWAADRGLLGSRARQSLGLARGLRGLGGRSGARRLPDLDLRGRPFGGDAAADDRRRDHARPRQSERAVAAA